MADVLHTIRRDERKYLRMPYIIEASRSFAMTTAQMDEQSRGLDDQARKNLKIH